MLDVSNDDSAQGRALASGVRGHTGLVLATRTPPLRESSLGRQRGRGCTRLLSNSFIAGLTQEGQRRVREEIFEILDRHGFVGPDALCVIPYSTELYITSKKS